MATFSIQKDTFLNVCFFKDFVFEILILEKLLYIVLLSGSMDFLLKSQMM